jgi:hypothetical protein
VIVVTRFTYKECRHQRSMFGVSIAHRAENSECIRRATGEHAPWRDHCVDTDPAFVAIHPGRFAVSSLALTPTSTR